MMILALDPATNCGWAAGRCGEAPIWGSRNFSDRLGNGAVLGKFRHWLNDRCFRLRPALIVYLPPYIPLHQKPKASGVPPMNALTVKRLACFEGFIEATGYELEIEVRQATDGEVSKFFIGSGRLPGGRAAKKAATVDMCAAFGWDVDGDDDAADALALWAMAEAQVDPIASRRRRDQLSAGPLFTPETKNASQAAIPRGARKTQPDDRSSSNGRQLQINNF